MSKSISQDPRIDGLLITEYPNGISFNDPVLSWQRTNQLGTAVTLSYSFMSSSSGDPDIVNFSGMNAAQRQAVNDILDMFSTFTNVTFVAEANGSDSDIQFGTAALSNLGRGTKGVTSYFFDNSSTAYTRFVDADVYLTNDDSSSQYANPTADSFAYHVLVHEIGHALGLEHPFEGIPVPFGTDSLRYTVMSYTDGFSQSEEPSTIMPFDFLALQHLYGANTTYRTGNDSYDMSSYRDGSIQLMWDAGGTDTIDLSSLSSAGPFGESGRFEHLVNLNVGIDTGAKVYLAEGTILENVIGSGFADRVIGNQAVNTIHTGDGNDWIASGAGNDVTNAGAGNDQFVNASGNDRFDGGDDDDEAIAFTGENILRGGADNDVLLGGTDDDRLYGDSGNDLLAGDGYSPYFSGDDIIDGGTGNDKLMGGGGADVFVFRTDSGSDTVAEYDLSNGSMIGSDFDVSQDRINFVGFGYSSEAEALADFTNSGGDAVFKHDSHSATLRLEGISIDDLDVSNILIDDSLI